MTKQYKKNKNVNITNSNAEDLISAFDKYLDEFKGHTLRTKQLYCGYIRSFLQIQFRSKKINLKYLSGEDIVKFVLKYKDRGGAKRAQAMTYSLRSFFRFLQQTEEINEDLLNSVPSITVHKTDPPRERLTPKELQMILNTCDRNDPMGKRDYAVLMLMIHLGLRACEICNLKLNDFDYEEGEIIITGKGSIDKLPLFQCLGEAITAYLLQGRPVCSSGFLFINARKPYQGFQKSSTCAKILKKALKRAGLNPKKKGTHLLRYSLATELLKQGATLYEIGFILRHKDIATTAIYAKVDVKNLSTLTMPWPI